MRILIAPDSFKGTLTAREAAEIIRKSLVYNIKECETKIFPMSDGGEGMVQAYINACGGEFVETIVSNPYMVKTSAIYGMTANNTAIIEMAQAAGLMLAETKNPLKTTTYGVGELILDSISKGAKQIILGLGGSATNDCGMGMMQALGFKFLDESGKNLFPVGENLAKVVKIVPCALPDVKITAACDVDSPLYGEKGAAYVFAPQKGADVQMVKFLDEGLRNISRVIEADIGKSVSDVAGAGAAGGLGAATLAFLGGKLLPGAELLMDEAGFDDMVEWADIIISGEGRLDAQSMTGKAVIRVAKRARGKKVILLCGSISSGAEEIYNLGVTAAFSAVRELNADVTKTCKGDLTALTDAVSRLILEFTI